MFLRFAKLYFFPLRITEGLSKHDAANPESGILGKGLSLKPPFLSLHCTLNTVIYIIFSLVRPWIGSRGKRASFLTMSPLSRGPGVTDWRCSWISAVWNLYFKPFFKNICFYPTRKFLSSLRFNMWIYKSFKVQTSWRYFRFLVIKTEAIFLTESYPYEIIILAK